MDRMTRLEKSVAELQRLTAKMVNTITLLAELNTDFVNDKKKDVLNKKPAKPVKNYKAKPKDLNMVIEFFREKNVNEPEKNATKFYNHYEASGWMRGKTKIKNWKMCLSSWDFTEQEKFKKDKWKYNSAGYYVGYCEKCGDTGLGKNLYELQHIASTCCGVDYLPSKPIKN